MRNRPPILAPLAVIAAALGLPAHAADAEKPADDQVIVPQVERRDIRLPKFPSRDFSIGLLAGTYATKNFGASAVGGVRLGYHITEDVFVEGTLGRTKVSDESFRQVLPGGVFASQTQTLSYYDVSAGYNLLPGEIFFSRNIAKASQGYILAGIGSTDFAGQKRQTISAGFGMRVIFSDRYAAQADVRDHIFSLDLLGKRQSTQNLEVTLGVTAYF
jgi:outer membrane beta-barrel protein